jgi:uncharacterized membrane protein YvbJ
MKHCDKCGHQNDDNATFCSNCGTNFSTSNNTTVNTGPALDSMTPARPANHLVWAILSTLLCCLPAGVVSIVYAAKVDTLYNAGNYDAAAEASKNAKTWAIVSAAVGFVFSIIYLGFMIYSMNI